MTQTATALDTRAPTLEVYLKFLPELWPHGIPTDDFHQLLDRLEDLIYLCVPKPLANNPFLTNEIPDPFSTVREDHEVSIGRLSYQSPLEVIILVSAISTVLTTTGLSMIKVARSFDAWKVEHARTKTDISLEYLKQSLLEVLPPLEPTATPVHNWDVEDTESETEEEEATWMDSEPTEEDKLRQVVLLLNQVDSLRAEIRGLNH